MVYQLARLIYSGMVFLSTPLLVRSINSRANRGKEDPSRLPERFGIASAGRPEGVVLWVHGASVGESLTALPVINHLLQQRKDLSVVVTTGTLTSARLLGTRLPDRAFHQFMPLDREQWVENFLSHWKPQTVVWMESEFWPNTVHAIHRRGIPLVLVNGRVSDRSFRRWQRLKPLIGGMLKCFTHCLAQSAQDARRLRELGAEKAIHGQNLKLAAPLLGFDAGELEHLKSCLGARKRWLMASTHAADDAVAVQVHSKIRQRFPDALGIIVPRHADRGQQVADCLRTGNHRVALRSRGEVPDQGTDFYVADTMGELGLFYRLSDIVCMGKSMTPPGGGQNPVEAVKLGCATLFGPYMTNFAELVDAMLASGAARQVNSVDDLQHAIVEWLDNDAVCLRVRENARQFGAGTSTIIHEASALVENCLPVEK